jgi:hypothetical protein
MKLIKKIFLVLAISLCFIVMILSGMGLYLYYHPEQIKPMVERSLSASTGTSCTIESLLFSLRPMALEAKGISFKPLKPQQAFSLEIRFIRSDLAVEGQWGHKSLILKDVQMNDPYLDLSSGWLNLPIITSEKRGPSVTARMIRDLFRFFFFQDIKFQSGEITGGRISAVKGDQAVHALEIQATAGTGKPLSLSFALEVRSSSRNMHFLAPSVNFLSDKSFDIKDLKFSGTLQSKGMKLQDFELGIQRMDVLSKFTYSHASKNFHAENFQVRCEGISFTPDSGKAGSLPVSEITAESMSMQTGFAYDMNQQRVSSAPLKFYIGGLSFINRANEPLQSMNINLKAKNVSGRYPVIEIKDVSVQIPQAKINTGTQDILIGDIGVHIPAGRIDTKKRSVVLPKVRFDAVGLKNLLLAIRLQKGKISLLVQGKKTDFFHAAAAYRLLPPDWDIAVRDSIRIEVAGAVDGPWQVQAKLSLEDLVFQNKDGNVMGEKISLGTGIEGVVDLNRSKISFAAQIAAKAGEALYDRYYLNLGKNPIVTSCNGTYDLQKRSIKLSKLRFDLTDILPLEIQGFFKQDLSKGDADLTVTLPQVSLKPIFHHFLQEPYKNEKPFLANLETGGTVSAELKIKRFQDAWQTIGHIGWLGGNLSLPEKGIALKGIQVDLPVWYRTGSVHAPVKTLNGKVEIQSVTTPLLPEQALSIPLDAGPNRIAVTTPTVIRVPGGDLRIGRVRIDKPFGPDLSIHTRLVFDGIKLQPLLSKIWMRPLEGSLTGVLDPVRYENHALTSQGEIAAEIFGGQILFSELGASGVFTSAPVFKLNATWDDLLLSEMTTDTPFGKIEGILKGHIRNFELAYSQPQKFDLLLETVNKKGIPQRISVKAVENIAQIGGGQSPFMGLAGAFGSFFKKFPYKKIGIRAYLENDVFTINGTIREDGTEYLVKRGSFSGVNVVNQNPENRISFKDMVKRTKRITHKKVPVVK